MRNSTRLFAIVLVLASGFAQAQWTWTPQTGRFVNLKRMPKETPELQLEYARTLMVEGDYRKAFRETEKFVEYYGSDVLADENQFLRGEIQMAQGQWMNAAKSFQQLIAAYPDSDRYDEAVRKQYDIGDQYYARGEQLAGKKWRIFRNRPYKRAGEVYTMVVDNQPFAPAAAEAQYKIGLCHYARKQYIDAAFEYQRVVEDYSASDWVNDASFGLAMCYYEASLPPNTTRPRVKWRLPPLMISKPVSPRTSAGWTCRKRRPRCAKPSPCSACKPPASTNDAGNSPPRSCTMNS